MVSESDLKTIHDAAAASLEHIYLNIGRHCEILTKKSDQWEREHSGTHPIHHDREEFRKVVEYLVRIAKELCDIRSSIENESLAEKLSLFTPAPELKQKSSLGSRWSYSCHHSHIFDYCNEFLRVLFATASLPDGITSLSSFESIIGNPRNKSLFEEEQRKERFWQQLLSRNTPQIIERKIARLTDLLFPRIPRSSNSSFGSWGLPKDLARLAIFEDRFQMSAAEYHRVSEELALELRLAESRLSAKGLPTSVASSSEVLHDNAYSRLSVNLDIPGRSTGKGTISFDGAEFEVRLDVCIWIKGLHEAQGKQLGLGEIRKRFPPELALFIDSSEAGDLFKKLPKVLQRCVKQPIRNKGYALILS